MSETTWLRAHQSRSGLRPASTPLHLDGYGRTVCAFRAIGGGIGAIGGLSYGKRQHGIPQMNIFFPSISHRQILNSSQAGLSWTEFELSQSVNIIELGQPVCHGLGKSRGLTLAFRRCLVRVQQSSSRQKRCQANYGVSLDLCIMAKIGLRLCA